MDHFKFFVPIVHIVLEVELDDFQVQVSPKQKNYDLIDVINL